MKRTNQGALQYDHSLDHAVEFFSKAGSLFEKPGSPHFFMNKKIGHARRQVGSSSSYFYWNGCEADRVTPLRSISERGGLSF